MSRPDGMWHREVDRQCWTRTSPGPVRSFNTLEAAETYAAGFRPARRLPNGTFIRDGARTGYGELRIENGRDVDGVVVLTTNDERAVFAVYLSAGSSFTVYGIPVGTYQIYVALGEDWDSAAARFTRRPQLFRFEDDFEYTILSSATGVQYTIWSISLQPVLFGGGRTEAVSLTEFPTLR